MFFDSNQINNKLTCKKCEGRLDEPRILPCGRSICSFCLEYIKLTNNREFQCLICDELHEMPKKGLPISETVLDLLSFKETQVSRGKAFDSLQDALKDLRNNKNLFKFGLYNRNDFIKEHFIDLRNEVQLATEELHEQIDDLNEKVIVEINDYEKQLIGLNKNHLESLKIFEILKKVESFHLKVEEYLKQPKLNDDILTKLNCDAIILKAKSDMEIKNLKEVILSGRFLKFKPNKEKLQKSFIGEMHENNILNSSIITGMNKINELMCLCEFPINQKWKLIYRASQDGFEASTFHTKCDDKPNTFIIIKSKNGNVFGGYTEQTWNHTGGYKTDPNAFIFSLINKITNYTLKMNCDDHENSIYCSDIDGPTFGDDLCIFDNSNQNKKSYSNLDHSYSHPYYEYETEEARSFLAGSYKFQVSEIEVYTKQ
jgi:hypothetical protein